MVNLKAGKYYYNRLGNIVGPIQEIQTDPKSDHQPNITFKFTDKIRTWTATGNFWSFDSISDYDLITEVPTRQTIQQPAPEVKVSPLWYYTVDQPGASPTKCATYDEAKASATALAKASPGTVVNILVVTTSVIFPKTTPVTTTYVIK